MLRHIVLGHQLQNFMSLCCLFRKCRLLPYKGRQQTLYETFLKPAPGENVFIKFVHNNEEKHNFVVLCPIQKQKRMPILER